MTGIYKITNNINNKCYIGQSIHIEKRLKEHKKRAFCGDEKTNKEYNKALYRAFRKYGLENFTFEILITCEKHLLDELETYYINYYNSNNKKYGYNETEGYINQSKGVIGEKHPNHSLSENDVYQIREDYKNHIEKETSYQNYKDRISFSGFSKIWNNITWKTVHQDVYTQENKKYYLYKRNARTGSNNPKAILNEQDVYNIRKRRKQGEEISTVYEDYKQTGITYNSFKNVWYYQNWKNIVV